MGLRDDILNTDDLPRKEVEVKEWGVTLYVRTMTGLERDHYEVDLMENRDLPIREKLRNMRAKLVVLTTVDENGERVFNDDDVEIVGGKSARALSTLADAAKDLNKIGDDEVEDEVKN